MSGDELVGLGQREALMQVLLASCQVAKMDRSERFYALLSLRGELNAWLRLEGLEVQKLEDNGYEYSEDTHVAAT